MAATDDLEVVGFDRTESGVDGMDRWTTLVATTLAGESVPRGRLDLLFVDADEMAALNKAHMGHDGPTDVLSFPLDSPPADSPPAGDVFANLPGDHDDETTEPPVHLGDVVVCPSVASAQASEHAGTFDAELTLLIVHGTLHILGHDHAEHDETEVMQARERVHMEAAGFNHPRWRNLT